MAKTQLSENLAKALIKGISNANDFVGGSISDERDRNMLYYLGELEGDLAEPEVERRSKAISMDVYAVVEWMKPQLVKMFTAGSDIVTAGSRNPEDDELAEIASEYANYQIVEKNHGKIVIQQWIHDALLQKVGFVKYYWDYDDATRESYEGIDQITLSEIINSGASPVDGSFVEYREGDQLVYDLTIEKNDQDGRCVIENLPPEQVLVSPDATVTEPIGSGIGHIVKRSRRYLDDAGYDVSELDDVELADKEGAERRTLEDIFGSLESENENKQPQDKQYWLIEWYQKLEKDGYYGLHKVVLSGKDNIIACEPIDYCPIVPLPCVIIPHRLFGTCPADLAARHQLSKSKTQRAIEDGLAFMVDPRLGFLSPNGSPLVDIDSLLDARPGGLVPMQDPAAVFPLYDSVPNLAAAYQHMEYQTVQSENETGFTRYSQGANADALNQTATGMNIITNRSDSRVELTARTFAETGFKTLFNGVFDLICKHQNKAETVKLSGKWVDVSPSDWLDRFDFTISTGLGTNNQDQKIQGLMMLQQGQDRMMQYGMVQPQHMFSLIDEQAKALGFNGADKFMSAEPPPPQPPPPDPMVEKLNHDMQMEQAKLQLDAQKQQANIDLKERELAMKQQENQLDAELEMAELEAKYGAELG